VLPPEIYCHLHMRILILNQPFYPDLVATGQYAADLAVALSAAGHDVTVLCSARGYDDPTLRFAPHETWRGVTIVRVSCTALGKATRARRATDFASYMLRCILRLISMGRFDVIVVLTTPPLISAVGAVWKALRGGRLIYWTMDLNPDEAIAAGWLAAGSFTARALRAIQNFSLRRSDHIVALDEFMRDRMVAAGTSFSSITVVPPWVQDDCVRFDEMGRTDFRKRHGLEGKFTVMYSGNHSPCHPLDTLMEAARQLEGNSEIVFAFVGGGSEFRKIQAHVATAGRKNILCLPYQPREQLAASLSAADLHVVVMGDAFVGIVHPSKIYNILALGTPVLYIGPARSHVTGLFDTLRQAPNLYAARHGETDTVVRHILRAQDGRASRSPVCDPAIGKTQLLSCIMEVITHASSSRGEGA
jgi:colanic acid biosynthesis glycosyl transferase WcaI